MNADQNYFLSGYVFSTTQNIKRSNFSLSIMACDLCGKMVSLVQAIIEGTELSVCEACSKHGKIIRKQMYAQNVSHQKTTQQKSMQGHTATPVKTPVQETILDIVKEYGHIIKESREKRQLTQDDFARLLNEKVTLLQKIEAGLAKPTIALAKKLEHALAIKLIEEVKDETQYESSKGKKEAFTLGDFIKIKKRK